MKWGIFGLSLLVYCLCQSEITASENLIRENEDNADSSAIMFTEEKCEAVPYRQNISVPGCISKIIDNRYCKGQCISGYVPENGVNGKFRCSSCQSHETEMKKVELSCENGQIKIVHVEIFKQCKCTQTKCNISNIVVDLPTNPPKTNRPCRDICRKCRRAKRIFRDLRRQKEQTEYLLESCLLPECKKRITRNIFERTRLQKVLKKKSCSECHLCKDRKRKRKNQ